MPDAEMPEHAGHPGAVRQAAVPAGHQPPVGHDLELPAQVLAAFGAGWLIAQLYGPILDRSGGSTAHHLPSISGLPREQRVAMSLHELDEALASAASGIGYQANLDAVEAVRRSGAWHAAFQEAIASLHELLLVQLTVKDARLGRAYGLGRSLSDTAWLPVDAGSFQQQLNPYRVAELDGWLSGLSDLLGHDAVTAVRGSLRTWSGWIADPFLGRRKLSWTRDTQNAELALRRQGAIWHDLLSCERDPASLLTIEAYAEAADDAVRRAGLLAGRILVHFWYAVASLFAVAGGLVYVSYAYAAGTAKFWGVFLTALGGSGALVQGVRGGISKMARRAEAPLWQVERDDALAAGATRLPVGATAGHIRRRITPRTFSRPATTAPRGESQQTQTPGTAIPATGAHAPVTPARESDDVTATDAQPPSGTA